MKSLMALVAGWRHSYYTTGDLLFLIQLDYLAIDEIVFRGIGCCAGETDQSGLRVDADRYLWNRTNYSN
jgi:hypothetical protein